MQAQIKEKREVAKGTLLVIFDLLGEEVDFKPGQYFWVTLLDPPYDDEKGPRRHISVVTSPNERGVLGLCTRLRDTAFKRSLAELPDRGRGRRRRAEGGLPPPRRHGPAVRVHRRRHRHHRVSLHAPLHRRGELPYRVTLVYSNRDRESTAFLDELLELEQANPNLRLVLTMTDDPVWDGETRRIDAELLRDHLGADLDSFTYLIAGPPAMVEGVGGTLEAAGVPEERSGRRASAATEPQRGPSDGKRSRIRSLKNAPLDSACMSSRKTLDRTPKYR